MATSKTVSFFQFILLSYSGKGISTKPTFCNIFTCEYPSGHVHPSRYDLDLICSAKSFYSFSKEYSYSFPFFTPSIYKNT